MPSTYTDADRIQWLIAHCDYLEHRDNHGRSANDQAHGGWWPQTDEHAQDTVEPDAIGLDIIEYIDQQINYERNL